MSRNAILMALATIPLALAAPAHADQPHVLDVAFAPSLGGMQVSVTDSAFPYAQNCAYDATSLGGLGSLAAPAHRDFVLRDKAPVTLQFPGVPTGTTWHVTIACRWVGNPFGGSMLDPGPAHYDNTVTY
ncbi:MAG: hypothetical protein QOF47_2961 [Mycobacterium sp.]|jgi:hypothetical protein|nr:hypothetical protein [Mycobacterium sp.]